MSSFGCWIQPRLATILTFLPVFDSTAASILAKVRLVQLEDGFFIATNHGEPMLFALGE